MLITTSSHYSVKITVEKIRHFLDKNNIKIFAEINHGQAARDVGLELRDEVVILFGDPKVGTYLMQENPTIGIDLPLKILVWQDETGTTQMAYADPDMLGKKYEIKQHQEILNKLKQFLVKIISSYDQ